MNHRIPVDVHAYNVAEKAHDAVLDKQGSPYILHPLRVGAQFSDAELRAVGYLHDVVEDTAISLTDLEMLGFNERIVNAVDLLTKREGDDYESFITRLVGSENRDAIAVKIADILDNMRPGYSESRLRERYVKALSRLYDAAAR